MALPSLFATASSPSELAFRLHFTTVHPLHSISIRSYILYLVIGIRYCGAVNQKLFSQYIALLELLHTKHTMTEPIRTTRPGETARKGTAEEKANKDEQREIVFEKKVWRLCSTHYFESRELTQR